MFFPGLIGNVPLYVLTMISECNDEHKSKRNFYAPAMHTEDISNTFDEDKDERNFYAPGGAY